MKGEATKLFEFLANHDAGEIERHEVSCTEFGDLRTSLWAMSSKILEAEDEQAKDAAGKVRALLSEMLTVPLVFDVSILERIQSIVGSVKDVEIRWGTDIGRLYSQAVNALIKLTQSRNPLRDVLEDCYSEIKNCGQTLRIYCHHRARVHFDSVLPAGIDGDRIFLHTVKNYRDSELFDVLIKVGPLRSRGWGTVIDAVLTAPKYRKMVNIVWSGCVNAPDFGYEPIESIQQLATRRMSNQHFDHPRKTLSSSWHTVIKTYGEDARKFTRAELLVDELSLLSQPSNEENLRNATLVQVDDDHGILFPPNGSVITLDPEVDEPFSIVQRSIADELEKGMFVILHDRLDFDLGGLQAELGFYSQIWRERLEQQWKESPSTLLDTLKAAGLNLLRIDLAIRNWIRLPDTVIHAPQRRDHFTILLQALGFDKHYIVSAQDGDIPFEILAWNEIRASRGEAIQAGFQEHEIVEEEVVTILRKSFNTICESCREKPTFHLNIPADCGINGKLRFYTVRGIEPGFRAPWQEFRTVHDLESIDQWRN